MPSIPHKPTDTVDLIYAAYEAQADEGFRQHLGASLIGDPCRRKLWYTFHWCTEAAHTGRVLRLFARGQNEELTFASDLRAIGCDVHTVDPETGKQFRFTECGGHFGGSMDAACHGLPEAPSAWHVVEMKTHNDRSFKALCKDGVEKSKPLHYAQMQIYMHLSGMKRALYMAVNKNDDSLYCERIHYNSDVAAGLIDKAASVIFSDEPLERISEKPDWYECKWCDHHPICHGGDLPAVNCRTCAHSTATDDGRWLCEYNDNDELSVDVQKTGCGDHLYNPFLVPFEYIGYDKDRGTQYRTKDGREFINCRNGSEAIGAYNSHELSVIDLALIGDAGVDRIRDQFGARVIG